MTDGRAFRVGLFNMLVVAHEMGFARQVANRVVFMDAGQIVEINVTGEFFAIPSTSAPSCS